MQLSKMCLPPRLSQANASHRVNIPRGGGGRTIHLSFSILKRGSELSTRQT